MGDIFDNVTGDILNSTLGADDVWLTLEEAEHFLGDPDVLHAVALVLGLLAITLSKRLPHLLAAIAATALGLYVALVVQDRQRFDEPIATVELPKGVWLPVILGIVTATAAAGLTYLAWKAALVLLTSGIIVLIALALCRLFQVSPERIFRIGASLLSMYRVVGAVVLVIAILASFFVVRKFHKHMAAFAAAHLGVLLLLSGLSYFAQRSGAEAPFSLLDDMARMMSEVRGGRCNLWEQAAPEDDGLEGCDCSAQCRTEIVAWLAGSITVLVFQYVLGRQKLKKEERKKRKGEEENVPLASAAASAPDDSPAPTTLGKNQDEA